MTTDASGAFRDNRGAGRYELDVDGASALAYYKIDHGVVDFTSTQTPPALRNRGIASRLIEQALQDARARGLKVKASCSFVQAYLEAHPEFSDLDAGS